MMSRINVAVSEEAKQVLTDYQNKHKIGDQGNALTALLLEVNETIYQDE